MTDIRCPNCQRDDQVQKVEAIWRAGTNVNTSSYRGSGWATTVNTSGGKATLGGGPVSTYGTSTTISQSYLAEELSPPFPPRRPAGRERKGSKDGNFVVTFLIAGVIGIVIAMLAMNSNRYMRIDHALIVGGGLGAIVASWAAASGKSWYRYHQEMPIWERKMAHWIKLFYCHRCGLVFEPGTTEAVPPTSLSRLLE